MARLVAATCPHCGAGIQLDPDVETVTCTFCGVSSFVQTPQRRAPEAAHPTEAPRTVIVVGAQAETQAQGSGCTWIAGLFVVLLPLMILAGVGVIPLPWDIPGVTTVNYFDEPELIHQALVEELGECRHEVLDDPRQPPRDFPPFVVPEDRYYFLGDNRDNSNDSRFWKPSSTVRRIDLKGPVIVNYWSWNNRHTWAEMANSSRRGMLAPA